MGKIVICNGRLSDTPYIIQGTERCLYSFEEICYYVRTNIYGVDIGFFSEELMNFIEEELCLKDMADKLRKLLQGGFGLKDVITALLCGTDLYDKDEIVETLALIDSISGMESWERRAHIGYRFLKEEKYLSALKCFRGILKEESLSEKDYGEVLKEMGVCYIYTSSFKSAADCFYKAYMHNRNRQSLFLTLLSLKLGDLEKEFDEKAGSFPEDDPIIKEVNEMWEAAKEKALLSSEYKELESIFELTRSNKIKEGYEKTEQKLSEFKHEYREGSRNGLVS